jgi:hypothetical protein
MSDQTLVRIFGKDLSRVVESFNNRLQHDGDYMTTRTHALHIISTRMYNGMDMARLHNHNFGTWNPAWKEQLASDLELFGYDVSFDNTLPSGLFTDSFLMEVRWSGRAQRTTNLDIARETRMNPQFSDSDSESEF